jgi:hypothetical protein
MVMEFEHLSHERRVKTISLVVGEETMRVIGKKFDLVHDALYGASKSIYVMERSDGEPFVPLKGNTHEHLGEVVLVMVCCTSIIILSIAAFKPIYFIIVHWMHVPLCVAIFDLFCISH